MCRSSSLKYIVLCGRWVHSLTVCYLLFTHTFRGWSFRSRSFAVYFCRWSFVVPDHLSFAFVADRLSFLIVCRFLLLLIVCSALLLLIVCSPTRQIICHILLLWLICIFVPDHSLYFLLTDTSFLADRCRPSVANCFWYFLVADLCSSSSLLIVLNYDYNNKISWSGGVRTRHN